jgi:hypothetical protein
MAARVRSTSDPTLKYNVKSLEQHRLEAKAAKQKYCKLYLINGCKCEGCDYDGIWCRECVSWEVSQCVCMNCGKAICNVHAANPKKNTRCRVCGLIAAAALTATK